MADRFQLTDWYNAYLPAVRATGFPHNIPDTTPELMRMELEAEGHHAYISDGGFVLFRECTLWPPPEMEDYEALERMGYPINVSSTELKDGMPRPGVPHLQAVLDELVDCWLTETVNLGVKVAWGDTALGFGGAPYAALRHFGFKRLRYTHAGDGWYRHWRVLP